MLIKEAQKEMRQVFLGGSVGSLVSGLIWLVSAALGTFVSTSHAILALVLVGIFIFPLTQLVLKLLGRPSGARRENPFNYLAMQVAFIVPLGLPVVGGAALYNIDWFYPAFMIILGAHYLPFMTLYGMWQWGLLGGVLIFAGLALALWLPGATFAVGGWFTGVVLLLFAVYAATIARRERLALAA
jgi:hypothetical protein